MTRTKGSEMGANGTRTETYSRLSPRDRQLRASDRDRDALAEILRQAHSAGRIDTDEFADRFARCLEAKTYAQLDQLIADLPTGEEVAQDGRWRPPAWPQTSWQPPSWSATPWSPPGANAANAATRHGPVAPFVILWAMITLVLLAATGGHILWIFLPIACIFWFSRSGRWRSRGPRRGYGDNSGHWV